MRFIEFHTSIDLNLEWKFLDDTLNHEGDILIFWNQGFKITSLFHLTLKLNL
jgi:hypothetical protein